MDTVTIADVDQAEARLAAAKAGDDPAEKQAAMQACGEIRSAWRAQEEAAGRRSGVAIDEVED